MIIEDPILGTLSGDAAKGLLEGSIDFGGSTVTVYVVVEGLGDEAAQEVPLKAARNFAADVAQADLRAREYAAQSMLDDEIVAEDLGWYCEEIGIEPITGAEEMAAFLSGRLRYIFVEPAGNYTIAYDDGELFGGHEINVYVSAEGAFVGWDIVG